MECRVGRLAYHAVERRSARGWRVHVAHGGQGRQLRLRLCRHVTQLVPHELIEFTFGDRAASVAFVPGANRVTVRVTFDAESDNPVEQQRQGWQAILDNFARHVHASR
ncbi:MAG: SRPBCC domain-containing protein [Burkholderiaceae bacterium]